MSLAGWQNCKCTDQISDYAGQVMNCHIFLFSPLFIISNFNFSFSRGSDRHMLRKSMR